MTYKSEFFDSKGNLLFVIESTQIDWLSAGMMFLGMYETLRCTKI